jgi:predicted MFS family arabinose efflux permease
MAVFRHMPAPERTSVLDPSMRRRLIKARITNGIAIFVVTSLSLFLLLYLGLGEGRRTYEKFFLENVTNQGKIIQGVMESSLRAGLFLKQYAGFEKLAEPVVASEDIDALIVFDQLGRKLYEVVDKNHPALPPPPPGLDNPKEGIVVTQVEGHHQIVIPLHDRFEIAGSLVVVSSTKRLEKRLDASFVPLFYLAAGLAFVFTVPITWLGPRLRNYRLPWLQISFGATFLLMASFVVGTLIALYSDGVQGKAEEAAFTLGQRLSDVVKFNLRIASFNGIEKVLNDYLTADPELSEAAIIVNDVSRVDTDAAKVGKPWNHEAGKYDYRIKLSKDDAAFRISVAVALPVRLVYEKVERSVRNFVALFIASGFLAGLFLQVANSMQGLESGAPSPAAPKPAIAEASLGNVKTVFFLAVFLENLTYSFLPKYMQEVAGASGMSVGFASAPFVAYYLCFALSLIPAQHFVERYGPRAVIWSGTLLSGVAVLSMFLPMHILMMIVVRALSGLGQGALFLGVQCYILAVVPPERKTQGSAVIVSGFQGGMISGLAIGSLLVSYLERPGIFVISGGIGFAAVAYSLLFLPAVAAANKARGLQSAIRQLGADIRKVIWSSEFLKAIFLIGIPAKAILTGVITFAMPLLLGQAGFQHEEIGQLIMLYGIGVLVASSYVSKLVDRTGKTDRVLFWGASGSAIGLVLIGLMGNPLLGSGALGVAITIAGVIAVGLAHGLINAPVITHVTDSNLASRIGANPVVAVYRFLERIGHVAGPFVVSQLFLIWGQSPQVILWIGVGIGALAFLFVSQGARPRVNAPGPEPVA